MALPFPAGAVREQPGTRAGRWARIADSRLLLAAQVLSLVAMTATVATRTWQDHPWFGIALVAIAVAVWAPELSRRRARSWWFVYVAGIFVYTLLRALADETLIPIRTQYVIDADQLLFAGEHPVTALQERLFSPADVSVLDFLAVQVHWSFFVAPHAAALIVFLKYREHFPRFAATLVGTMYLGLLLFFLLPTTPPWLAAQEGALPGAYRVMDFVGGRVSPGTYESFYASLGEPNSVAAMPSIHMAITFVLYLWARERHPRLALASLVYCAAMAFSLVYLAEHYVLDLLVGVACAVVCYAAVKRWMPTPASSG